MVRSASISLLFAVVLFSPTEPAEAQQAKEREGETRARSSAFLQPDPRVSRQDQPVFLSPYRTRVQVQRREEPPRLAVPEGVFFSAAWVEPGVARPIGAGTLREYVKPTATPSVDGLMAQRFERMILELEPGFSASVGDELQVFRVMRPLQDRGWIAKPMGSVTVLSNDAGTATVEVRSLFGPMAPGDHVRPMPTFPLRLGEMPRDLEPGSPRATILGWVDPHQLPQVGNVALLNVGSRDGVSVGDEFVTEGRAAEDGTPVIVGRVQVVGTTEGTSSARIIQLDGPVFALGTELVRVKAMP